MQKTFLKSLTAGVVSLALVSACSTMNKSKETAHKCNSKKEANDTKATAAATKKENHKCTAKKENNSCSAAKKHKKADDKNKTQSSSEK